MKMPKGLYLLALLASVMGADNEYAQLRRAYIVGSLPTCAEDEYFVYTSAGLICTTLHFDPVMLPDCRTSGQLLTYTNTGGGGAYGCTSKGTESLSPGDISMINAQYQAIQNQESFIAQIEQGMRVKGSGYCGQTTSQPSAAFVDGTATGIAAAASLCAKVTGCGSGAHLCTVYEMYHSIIDGALPSAMDLEKSWVYQASFSQEFSDNTGNQKEPGAGLADNCGSFTVGDSSRKWYGTAVQWTTADSGQKALKFFAGPPSVGIPGTTAVVANPSAVGCDSVLPIACCK